MQPAVALDGIQVIGEPALPAVAKLRLITKGQLKREGAGEGNGGSCHEENEQTGVCSAVEKKNQPVEKREHQIKQRLKAHTDPTMFMRRTAEFFQKTELKGEDSEEGEWGGQLEGVIFVDCRAQDAQVTRHKTKVTRHTSYVTRQCALRALTS
jgi:hypothetical protein